MKDIEKFLCMTREKKPLVHFITNYVTANDCANITLAAGAAPIMADAIQEVEEIVMQSAALVINIGTLNERTSAAMLAAGRCANRLRRPVVFDPVGAGVSKLRDDMVRLLMREVNFSIIKGNISEMKFLMDGVNYSRGVDARVSDLITEKNLSDAIDFARSLSRWAGSVIVITGPIDIVVDAQEAYVVRNGSARMTEVTGTGCMGGALIGSYVGACPENAIQAAVAAVSAVGVCGELACERLGDGGSGSYRTLLIDAMSKLDAKVFSARTRAERIEKSLTGGG